MIRQPRHRTVVLLAVACAGATAVTFAAPPLPPPEALQRAVDAHPEVRAAQARAREAASSSRITALGPYDWTLSAGAARRRTDNEGNFNEWETALERGLRLPGKASLDRELGRLEAAQADASATWAKRNVAAQLLDEWFRCVSAHEHARIAGEDVIATATIAAAVAARRRAGDAAALDAALAEAELATVGAEAAEARSQGVAAARLLSTRMEGVSCALSGWDAPRAEPDRSEAAVPGVRAGNAAATDPSVLAAERAAERAVLAAERARLERWPDPTLGVRYGSERDGEEKIGGLSISVPIGTRRRGAESARARAAAEAAIADLESARAQATRRRMELQAEGERSRAAWSQRAEAARKQDEAARLSQRAFELGEYSLSEALVQRRAALRVRLAERDAALDVWRTMALQDALYAQPVGDASPGTSQP